MAKRIRDAYIRSTLAAKIRISYFLLLIPILLFLVIAMYQMLERNREYENMIRSVLVASEFNLDFKKDFDYETYLLIVGNKTPEESKMSGLLADAQGIVEDLDTLTTTDENRARLDSVRTYLSNLERYKERIEDNLLHEEHYDENMLIWENDVQIVTGLLREAFFEYTYYEIRDLQTAREQYRRFVETFAQVIFISFLILAVLFFALSYYIPRTITRPIRELSDVTDQVARGNLSVHASVRGGPEVVMLRDSMNAMIDQINELLSQITKEQVRLRKAEFSLLQAQINPHFLYNTLDAIIWLAEAGQQKQVVGMVGSLSEFFRTSLNQGRDIIPLREELQHVRSYLEIQQVRYQDILSYGIDVAEELEATLIPKITIQPLVENALYHGIKNRRGGGRITVTGMREAVGEGSPAGRIRIEVRDNGIGMRRDRLLQVQEGIEKRQPGGTDSYGLYNVNERIRLHFGTDYGITIASEYEQGTVIAILLPEKNQPIS